MNACWSFNECCLWTVFLRHGIRGHVCMMLASTQWLLCRIPGLPFLNEHSHPPNTPNTQHAEDCKAHIHTHPVCAARVRVQRRNHNPQPIPNGQQSTPSYEQQQHNRSEGSSPVRLQGCAARRQPTGRCPNTTVVTTPPEAST